MSEPFWVLETVILASSVLYELIGPACAKLALYLSRSYAVSLEERAEEAENKNDKEVHHKITDETNKKYNKSRDEVELLIARIQAIQRELREDAENISEEEKAFTEAAEEQCGA